jgi:glutaredoxin 3
MVPARVADPTMLCKAMSSITVYTTDPCGFCSRVKEFLRAHEVEFTEVNLSKDEAGRAQLVRTTGMMTFPQVVVDGSLIGGFHETKAALESGRLDELRAA